MLLSEERSQTIKEKMRRWQLGEVHLLMRHEAGVDVSLAEIVSQAVAVCSENGLDVLVVDTFSEWTGLRGDAENSAGEVLAAMKPLQAAAAAGLAVVLIAHQRKSDGEHGSAVRGSNALTGAVDIIWRLNAAAAAYPGTRAS